MDPDDGINDDGPFARWLPPDDRLWRHPSEMTGDRVGDLVTTGPARSAAGRMWTVAVVAGLVGALVASGIGSATGEFSHPSVLRPVQYFVGPPSVQTTAVQSTDELAQPNWPAIYKVISPSLVAITADGYDGEVTGAGVLWQSQGSEAYVLTDAMTVAGAGTVQVHFTGSGSILGGQVVGSDGQAGIAVVKVTGISRPLAVLGHLADLQIGESVAALGPQGPSMGPVASLSEGTVSSLDREVHVSAGPTMLGVIGIDSSGAPPGGAAVVEPDGVVAGLVVSIQSSDPVTAGMTLAVPIDVAVAVADQLVAGHAPAHPWLGVIETDSLLRTDAAQLGVAGGATVETVMAPSPATRVGLRPGDVITSLNGAAITSSAALVVATDACQPHRPISISFVRGNQTTRTTIVPDDQPATVSP
ncbi:MAG: S1C family serine protease [Acidimicrobiales bacterium]